MLRNGWKEIANHVQRSVRTVRRWERLGLPVRRINHSVSSPVIARSEDLDQWLTRRSDNVHPLALAKFAETHLLHKQAAATRRRSAELMRAAEQIMIRSAGLRA